MLPTPYFNRRAWARIALAGSVSVLMAGVCLPAATDAQVSAPVQLSASEVQAIIAAGASSLADSTVAIAVVDRAGTILGVYRRPQAAATAPDLAVSLARTGAYFSNDQAPLSSRTVRFISGIHFPPGIDNQSNAALYGIENTNRGCELDATGGASFNAGQFVPRARSLAGTFTSAAGASPVGCSPTTPQACGVGISTGKPDLYDTGAAFSTPVNPGGLPLYRGGRVIGGVGVAGVSPERAEYAAAIAAAGTRGTTGITTGLTFPSPALPAPGAVFIGGIRLPFFSNCIDFACVQATIDRRPSGSAPGSFSTADLLVPSTQFPGQAAQLAPEGYLIGPRASGASGGMTQVEVAKLIDLAVARANVTRAQIRLPLGQATRMVIAVTDRTGAILAAYRMPDATMFSLDVSAAKARNAYYFSSREGYDVLRDYVRRSPGGYDWQPDPPAGQGWALTARTLSYGGQPLFPPGIVDPDRNPTAGGPFFGLFDYDARNACTEGPGPSRGTSVPELGIVWFPGSAPLYRNGTLVGGIGVSGDGVEQDDYVTAAAVQGFEPPDSLRVDNSFISTGRGEPVRLPYFKFPRNPELP